MRLRKKPWIAEAIREFDDILVDPGHDERWSDIFGRSAPLHVELGTGRGNFITGMAELHPHINFVGIEAVPDVLYCALCKVRERNLPNIRLVLFNVNELTELFMPGEIDRLYINFCDPWPKNRHAKRRLTHRRFLEMYRELVKENSELHFKTDNEALFEFSLNEFAEAKLGLHNISLDLHNSGFPNNVMTEYEARFKALGMKIFRCEARFEPLCKT